MDESSAPVLGVLYHAIGGLAAASFNIPYLKVRGLPWENAWLLGGLFSWIIAPTVAASERLVSELDLDALTHSYRGVDRNEYEQLQEAFILGHSLLTARGIPCSGEDDTKTVLAIKPSMLADRSAKLSPPITAATPSSLAKTAHSLSRSPTASQSFAAWAFITRSRATASAWKRPFGRVPLRCSTSPRGLTVAEGQSLTRAKQWTGRS